mgnify:FL=1
MSAHAPHLQAIHRILVALDGSGHSLAALDAALDLAAQLRAELEALFVEDVDLLRLADLPCARVTSLVSLEAERIDRPRMERQIRVQVTRVQATLERRAAARGVRATFRSVRGEVADQVLEAAAAADLLSLGRAGVGGSDWPRTGSTVRAALAAGRPILVAERAPAAGQGLLVAYDGSAADASALALAAQLAADTRQPLRVLLLAESAEALEALAGRVRDQLAGWGVRAELSYSQGEPAAAILAAARRMRPALVVLGLGGEGDRAKERAERVLGSVGRPLLLVP